MTSALISAGELASVMETGEQPAVLDVRWSLATGADTDGYWRGHIPSAVFVDLDRELAAPPGGGRGRHPLPERAAFEAAMRRAGVGAARPVVVYDESGGLSAARAWWLLRYFGHRDVRVLDGGLAAWADEGRELSGALPAPTPGDFTARPGGMALLDAGGAAALAIDGILLDARAVERYIGTNEPVDPVAGHIPGARSAPTSENLGQGGRFLDPAALRGRFRDLGVGERSRVGVYCGSGVTAAHEVLALEVAGFRAALYAGSWSEWVSDPGRPVATGAEPG